MPHIDQVTFEKEALAFLSEHAEPLPPAQITWGQGSDVVGNRSELSSDEEKRMLTEARA
jgi:hypothetical protein